MAQNITLMGASYPDVPAVELPKTGGGTARFDDTSIADATAGDIRSGKSAVVNGSLVNGSLSETTAATPTLSLVSSAGTSYIEGVTNQTAGIVPQAQKRGTYSLTRIAGQTITPTTSEQTVIANGAVVHAYNGAVKVGKIPSEYIVPSGTKTITENGTGIDVKAYEKVDVSVPTGGGGKAGQLQSRTARTSSTTYTDMGFEITVAKTGTYNIYWTGYRSSTGGTNGAQIYVNGAASGSAVTTFNASYANSQNGVRSNVSLNAGDVVTIRARARSNSYYMYIMNLAIIEV